MSNVSGLYVRTCQECGRKQEAKPPAEYKSDSWKDLQCRGCKSPGLNYGSYGWERTFNGQLVRVQVDDV